MGVFHVFKIEQMVPNCAKHQKSASKVKFRQSSSSCERVLVIAQELMLKKLCNSQKLGSCDFSQITNKVLNKGRSTVPSLFNRLEVLSSASFKAKLLAKNFSENSNFDDSGISLPTFPFRTNHVSLYLLFLLELI